MVQIPAVLFGMLTAVFILETICVVGFAILVYRSMKK